MPPHIIVLDVSLPLAVSIVGLFSHKHCLVEGSHLQLATVDLMRAPGAWVVNFEAASVDFTPLSTVAADVRFPIGCYTQQFIRTHSNEAQDKNLQRLQTEHRKQQNPKKTLLNGFSNFFFSVGREFNCSSWN